MARAEADRVSGAGGQRGEVARGEQGRPVGFGQGHIRPVHSRRLRGQAHGRADPLLLEGARVGPGRQAHGIQRDGRLGNGLAGTGGLAGEMDQCSGWRGQVAAAGAAVSQGVHPRQAGPERSDLHLRPGLLRAAPQRHQGRRPRPRSGLHPLRPAGALRHLRRHAPVEKRPERSRRDPGQRLVQHAHAVRLGLRQGPLAGPARPAVPVGDHVRRRLEDGRRQRRDVAGHDRPDRLRQHPQRREV